MTESVEKVQEPSHEENRHDQLTSAPESTEADAAPRIEVSERTNGATRIDIAEDAPVRPSDPSTRSQSDLAQGPSQTS
ncbi:MAG: multidrug transporter [Mycetocola sp.]